MRGGKSPSRWVRGLGNLERTRHNFRYPHS